MKEIHRTPWFNLEGYNACTVHYIDGSKKTVLQHREVMEGVLGRTLESSEIVHPIDEVRGNNRKDNLELTDRVAHGRHHAKARHAEPLMLRCILCKKEFTRSGRLERHNRKQGKIGPFCGKVCAGRNSRAKQMAAGQVNLRA